MFNLYFKKFIGIYARDKDENTIECAGYATNEFKSSVGIIMNLVKLELV